MLFNWPLPPSLIPALDAIPNGYRFGVSRTTTTSPHSHKGLDMGTVGQTVVAAQNGTIFKAYAYTPLGGPGIIDIDHGTDTYQWRTRYLHVDPNSFAEFGVKAGMTVMSGQPIARIGKLASGPHLHFEVRSCPAGSTCAWPRGWTATDPLRLLGGNPAVAAGGSVILVAAIGAALYLLIRGA